MKKIIKRMQNRIMQHQKENGFETIFDFLNEDLADLEQQLKNCNLQNVSQQRELFVSFARFVHNYGKGSYGTSYEEMFSEWLKKRNK